MRGHNFDGIDDYVNVVGLVLNPTYSIYMWIRTTTSVDAVLFSVNRNQHSTEFDEDLLTLKVSDLIPSVSIFEGKTLINDLSSSSPLNDNSWG